MLITILIDTIKLADKVLKWLHIRFISTRSLHNTIYVEAKNPFQSPLKIRDKMSKMAPSVETSQVAKYGPWAHERL